MKAQLMNMFDGACRRNALPLAVLILLSGCAAQLEHRQGLDLIAQGDAVKGIDSLRRASEMEPRNPIYQVDFVNQKMRIVTTLLDRAEAAAETGSRDTAKQIYQDVLAIEPHNDQATAGIKRLDSERRAEAQLQQAEMLMQANKSEAVLDITRRVLKDLPQNAKAKQLQREAEERLDGERQIREEKLAARAAFRRPVTLSFRDTPLKMVFEALSKAANVNVVVDRDVKNDLRTTIFVKDAAIEDAIDVILMQNQLEKRVLNSNTILVYPATAAKQKELAELKVRSFHLSNIDPTLMANIIKSMVKTKDIVTDAKANLLVMRDTPEAISLAERLVAANDLADPEVMLEVRVLEVSTTRATDLGLKLPTSFTASTPSVGTGSGGGITLSDIKSAVRAPSSLLGTPLSATINLMMQDSDTNILANPRIRARNKEKARILVGDKLPQITNLISPQQAGQSSVMTGSIQYVDVGIKLDVEPEVYGDNDVGIKINLEVSNVTNTLTTQSGTAYQIGTRSAQTNLRLHDGETQIMAGLINDVDRNTSQHVPGLGQLPILGHLFSDRNTNGQKTEIVLAITPHIIRPFAQVDMRNADAWSGSDSSIRDRQLRIDTIGTLKADPIKPEPAAALSQGVRPALPTPFDPNGEGTPVMPVAPTMPTPVVPSVPAPAAPPSVAPAPLPVSATEPNPNQSQVVPRFGNLIRPTPPAEPAPGN